MGGADPRRLSGRPPARPRRAARRAPAGCQRMAPGLHRRRERARPRRPHVPAGGDGCVRGRVRPARAGGRGPSRALLGLRPGDPRAARARPRPLHGLQRRALRGLLRLVRRTRRLPPRAGHRVRGRHLRRGPRAPLPGRGLRGAAGGEPAAGARLSLLTPVRADASLLRAGDGAAASGRSAAADGRRHREHPRRGIDARDRPRRPGGRDAGQPRERGRRRLVRAHGGTGGARPLPPPPRLPPARSRPR